MKEEKFGHKKKIMGAVLSSSLFSIFFVFLIVVMSYFQFTESDKMPWALYVFMVGILLIPILGTVSNLWMRIHEIRGGEEDEASQY